MQRQDCNKSPTKSPQLEPPSLDAALAKPDDKELFYTASVHFLQKRLQEKSHKIGSKPTSQSCCNLNSTIDKYQLVGQWDQTDLSFNILNADSSPLPMHQLLPFPKSKKDGLFTRVKNTFRKYRQRLEVNYTSVVDDAESKSISNFKFPRCQRFHKTPRASVLLQISEEQTDDSSKQSSSSKIVVQSNSKCSLSKDGKLDQQSFR